MIARSDAAMGCRGDRLLSSGLIEKSEHGWIGESRRRSVSRRAIRFFGACKEGKIGARDDKKHHAGKPDEVAAEETTLKI